MKFVEGLWHSLKVICAGLYWLMFICLIWAGFALMGTSPQWGWGNLAFVLALFAAKGYAGRWIKGGASYVAGCGAIAAYLTFAAIATGWQNI